MKKLVIIPFAMILFLFTSCDKVKNPIVPKAAAVGVNFITNDNLSVSNFKKTLLEDYTGMKCPNCPDAAVTASNLSTTYGASLVVMAVHAGGFAKPFGAYANQDYRTDPGDVWNGSTGFNIPSYPNGIVNRKNYGSGLIVLHTSWSSIIPSSLNDPFIVKLDVYTKYDTTLKVLNVDVKSTFKATYTNNVMYSAVVIQDEIEGKQDVHGVETDGYIFEHMLRGSMNGDWGKTLKAAPIAANDTARVSESADISTFKYTPTNVPANIDYKKAYVVVFAHDALTKEVLQVEKVKIKK